MADQIGKEDEPADHANLPDTDAAQEFSDLVWFAHADPLIPRTTKLAFNSIGHECRFNELRRL
jgi:hypothetical protein